MTEAPQSIADRIAALRLNQAGRPPPPSYERAAGVSDTRPRPPPPSTPARPILPARPALPARTQSSNVPPCEDYAAVSNAAVHNLPEGIRPDGAAHETMNAASRPMLPPRTPTQTSQSPALPTRRPTESPALPPRKPSETPSWEGRRLSEYSLPRRGSNESTTSVNTARSGLSGNSTMPADRMKAPAYDPASLPALPPKRTKADKDAEYDRYNSTSAYKRGLKTTKSSTSVPQLSSVSVPPLPSKPAVPSLPLRASSAQAPQASSVPCPVPGRREIAAPPPKKSVLSMGFDNPDTVPAEVPGDAPALQSQVDGHDLPPPIPATSKPDLAAIRASKPSINGVHAVPNSGSFGSCLLCRDYAGPDNHAAQFPRRSLPSQEVGWLAQQLTAPFPSLTDKARVIFTWLHLNIAYDTVAFFNNSVKPATPQSTLGTGLAVCEGYAGLFAALAMKGGLEAYVVSGHGKGYGYAELPPGCPLPPYSAGHAWNAVKIDGGQWKLIDCCWGAGAVGGKDRPYEKRFAPERFTQSNNDFGLDHFPGDTSKQFRNDGSTVSWAEYITGSKNGCGASFFDGYVAEEGLDKTTFKPNASKIALSHQPGPTVRFSFQKTCPHWDPVRCGKGPYYLYVLHLAGLDGTAKNHVPFETNGDVWWCDVAVQDLGRSGQKVRIGVVTQINGADGRGLTIARYREMKGRVGMAFGFVCQWELV